MKGKAMDWIWLAFKVLSFVITILKEAMSYEKDNGGGLLTRAAKHEKDKHKDTPA